jgi:hypothetical protein
VTTFIDHVTDQLNLRWAWEKVRREAAPGDVWLDEIELAGFELELEKNLQNLAVEFRKLRYRLQPLKPLPYPKDNDKKGNPRLRQMFQVSIRDQVAWTAMVNIIGPYVDSKMPAWSYGHRLYRSIWVEEEEDGKKRRKIGSYRHAAGHMYLPFGQSWPIFRRHVYLAIRAMAKAINVQPELDDERAEEELDIQERLAPNQQCPFVRPEYWQNRTGIGGDDKLYWCSIDLAKFYPTLNLGVILKNIVQQLPYAWRGDAERLLESMFVFHLDLDEWLPQDLKKVDLNSTDKTFRHIPTGLFVAGFLANAGLLNVDREVENRLKDRNIAHFRFVDDHIVLAYSFEDLSSWVNDYIDILKNERTGARVNPSKIEPEEFATFIKRTKRAPKRTISPKCLENATKACRLDPKFPSPLMTKTLELISGIARMDFNLLEPDELTNLTEQLEHLLLVDLPAEEMPEKTRLSFAATRLCRLAECRLANAEARTNLRFQEATLNSQMKDRQNTKEGRDKLGYELKGVRIKLKEEDDRIEREIHRPFRLLRKVLFERPDRVRLWTRAVLMCRHTGVNALGELLEDIQRERSKNPLAAEYLYANTLSLLGTQILIAARIYRDDEAAPWRRQAAKSFLKNVRTTRIELSEEKNSFQFLRLSWHQYCFGMWCANLVLCDKTPQQEHLVDIHFPKYLLKIGEQYLKKTIMGHSPTQRAWWATRMTLRDLAPHAAPLAKVLGERLGQSMETNAFWRFFPLDVPNSMLRSIAKERQFNLNSNIMAGWWFDALRTRTIEIISSMPEGSNNIPGSVRRNLAIRRHNTASLYEWCDYLQQLIGEHFSDPRNGEWTALEFVRQISLLLSGKQTLQVNYIKNARRSRNNLPFVHPANFRIPAEWLQGSTLQWEKWQKLVCPENTNTKISYVPKSERINDSRYRPLSMENALFLSVNPVRGLGLLLYGLLKRDFNLPTLWNGPGHADVLGMLPKLLLREMTCSSWTLGVLAGCLQPRVTENLHLKLYPLEGYTSQDDSLRDPVAFQYASEVCKAIEICQDVLKEQQLSTLKHKARQLTPVSIHQLTRPEWNKVFAASIHEEGNANE